MKVMLIVILIIAGLYLLGRWILTVANGPVERDIKDRYEDTDF